MKKLYIIAVSILTSLSAYQSQAQITLDSTALQSRLDSIYNAPSENWIAGIVASVRYENQHWDGATGWAYIDSLQMTTDYHFRYYSATKSVTAAAVLEQVVQGNMDLDDHLGKYLTTITNPNIDTTVTLRQLLTHQTGFPDYTYDDDVAVAVTFDGLNGNFTYDPLEVMNDTDYVDPPLFTPGTQRQYSSTNYILLGLAMEALPGIDSIEQHYRTTLLDPAGMSETAFYPAESISGDEPAAHDELSQYGLQAFFPDYVVAGTVQEVPIPLAGVGSIAWTTGGLVGTARDLSRWSQEFYEGNIVSEAALDSVFASIDDFGTPASNFPGYGIFLESGIGPNVVGHGGAAPGYRSNMVYDRNNNIALGICTNQGEGSLNKVANALLNEVLGITTSRADASAQANWPMQLSTPYPNPASDLLSVDISVRTAQPALVQVFDLQGRELHRQHFSGVELNTGTTSVSLPVADLAAGIYLVRLSTEGTTQVQRFVKQ